MGWIKFEKDLLTDPRVLRIARTLQERMTVTYDETRFDGYSFSNSQALPGVTLVCGALIRIWSLGDTHLDAEDVLPLGIKELDELVGIPGFCDLLPSDWLLRVDENTVKLPGFHEHNGTEAKKKAQVQKRVERFRKRNEPALKQRNARALPDQDQDQDHKRVNPSRAVALPDWLDKEKWQAYVKTRKAKAREPESLKAAIEKLDGFRAAGHDPNQIVATSLANGWQGLFEPKVNGSGGNGSGPPWWSSNEGIQAKAAELHLESRKGESWNDLKARISAAMEATT